VLYLVPMDDKTPKSARPEPSVHLRAHPKSKEAWLQAATKSARLTVQQRIKGKKRALLGNLPARASHAQLMEGYWKAPRCTAEKRDGTRCRLPVVRGSDRCHFHEGVERNPSCAAAGRRYLEGTLRLPSGRFKTHPDALAARGKDAGEPE
jgi:hypothetical protein